MKSILAKVKFLVVASVILTLGFLGAAYAPATYAQMDELNEVQLGLGDQGNVADLSFTPRDFVIYAGDTVRWTNIGGGTPHTVTSVTGAFDSTPDFVIPPPAEVATALFGPGGFLLPGQTYSFTFEEAGEVNYWCKLHPLMLGKVIVTDDQAPPNSVMYVTSGWGSETTSVDAFGPREITVAKGTTVIWTNQGVYQPHTVTSSLYDSSPNWTQEAAEGFGQLSFLWKDSTFEFTFNEVGTFPYFCKLHAGMRGTVIVLPAKAMSAEMGMMDGEKKEMEMMAGAAGPEGPPGPAGAQGPPGPAGSAGDSGLVFGSLAIAIIAIALSGASMVRSKKK